MNEQYRIVRSVAPTVEPVTLADLQAHTFAYNSADESLLTALIATARELFELHTGLALVDQTWKLMLPRFFQSIILPKPPLRSVESIQYYDTSGQLQTLASSVYRNSAHGEVTAAYGKTYPATEGQRPDAVTITYKAGVHTVNGSPAAIDTGTLADNPMTGNYELARQAIMMMVTHLYENRGVVAPVQLTECPMSYQAMVDACRQEWA